MERRKIRPGSANPLQGQSVEVPQSLIDKGYVYPNGILTPEGELYLHQLKLLEWMAKKQQQEQQQQESADDDHP